MRDIVATIQAEQDEIIRLDHRGVLVIGPSPAFLNHISRFLPSLGSLTVHGVLAAAVADRQRTQRYGSTPRRRNGPGTRRGRAGCRTTRPARCSPRSSRTWSPNGRRRGSAGAGRRAAAWTVSDVRLLDELVDLQGQDTAADRAVGQAAARQRRAEPEYAEGAMDILTPDRGEMGEDIQLRVTELDAVLVVEPERILADGAAGSADLEVALTRATQRLGVLHLGALPEALTGLVDTGASPVGRPLVGEQSEADHVGEPSLQAAHGAVGVFPGPQPTFSLSTVHRHALRRRQSGHGH